jgi:hypothetical protein
MAGGDHLSSETGAGASSDSHDMASYDREFTTVVDRRAQIRVGLSTERGDVTAFFVQLEYWYDGEWLEVARFDHAHETPLGHDVEDEGLHLDRYRGGEKIGWRTASRRWS